MMELWDIILIGLITAVMSIAVTFLMNRLLTQKILMPQIDKKLESLNKIGGAVNKIFSEKGVDVRQFKSLEKSVAKDIFEQFPEFKIVLGLLSPETLEKIEANPEMALQLLTRYKPLIDQFLGQKQQQQATFDL